jgi:hypothetical protein
MKKKRVCIAPPSATGGEGYYFENHVQASFVALMFSKGFAPLCPEYEIFKVMLQTNKYGFETDDALVFLKKGRQERKLLCQIKLTLHTTPGDKAFKACIEDAWKDYNNPKVFNKDNDVFFIITSNLSREDVVTVKLLQDIRSSNSSDDFFRTINTYKITSKQKKEKVNDLKTMLTNASSKETESKIYPGDEIFFDFYKHIYILNYDVTEKESVVLSLLHSHLNQVCHHQSQNIWNKIQDFVGNMNFHAGTITNDNLRDFLEDNDLINKDVLRNVDDIACKIKGFDQKIWLKALIVGGWDHSNTSDRLIIEKIAGIPYAVFFEEIQRIEQNCPEVFNINHNYWSIKDRKTIWRHFSEKFIDDDLYCVKKIFIDVLKEIHPRYSMPVNERYLAQLLSKNFSYSYYIRKSISETLAILTTVDCSYSRCSLNVNVAIANAIVKELFEKSSVDLWGSLNDVVAILAEACPDEFISAVDSSFDLIVALYDQDADPLWGPFDDVGLSRSFEILAHSQKYFLRVIDFLAEVVQKMSEKPSENRAFRTLCDILQPYHKLIDIPFEIQECAIKNLFKKRPDVAWKLSMETLGSRMQVVATISEPKWQNWPITDQSKQNDYELVKARLLQNQKEMLSLAKKEYSRIPELIRNIQFLAKDVRQELYDVLQNIDIPCLNSRLQYEIWQELRHECDFDRGLRTELESIRDLFAPTDVFMKNQQYFSDDFYLHMFVGKHEYDEIERRKEDDRLHALQEIYESGEIEIVLKFCENIENSYTAGELFYRVKQNAEASLFPARLLNSSVKIRSFLSGYISAKCANETEWVNKICVNEWSDDEKKQFLLLAPFKKNIWNLVACWLNDDSEYWKFVDLRHWQEDNLEFAVKKFLMCGRPKSALYCLFVQLHRHKNIDCNDCIRALRNSISSEETQKYYYETKELIQYLQQQDNLDENDMLDIECAYSPMIETEHDLQPKFINKAICESPENFAALVRFAYRAKSDVGKDLNLTQEEKNRAGNSHRILRIWNEIPGKNGETFEIDKFLSWYEKTKKICQKDDRLDIALEIIGKKMKYTPADSDGLWINREIAALLDSREGKSLRSGFHSEEINSNGAYSSGDCVRFVADYEKKAEALRKSGYTRFAETIDDLADMYKNEVKRLS